MRYPVNTDAFRRSRIANAIYVAFAALVTGCGGGGSADTSAPTVQGADSGHSSALATAVNSTPQVTCDAAGIGSVKLISDLPTLPTTTPPNDSSATITSVSTGTTAAPASVPYCLVKVLVPPAINIWVGLPMNGQWNGRLQSEGGGGYAGSVGVATGSINGGYIGIQTDTGHSGGSGTFGCLNNCSGNNAANPGAPDVQLQSDFAYRSEHEMAVIGKQLAQAFYGQLPVYSYWNGCSTGGRQGMRMAEQFPADYDGILAGAPAFHWDRFIAAEIWPEVAQQNTAGYILSGAKQTLATNAAIAACDAQDGVVDGVLTDPRQCTYNPVNDATITKASCTSADNTCLTPAEATAIQQIWSGPVNASGKQLWYGPERGAALNGLGGTNPFAISVAHAQYWTYFDPTWDWHTLTFANYESYFKLAMIQMNPMMATENPDLSAFRNRGGKLVMYHGFADQLIPSRGSIFYYDATTNYLGGGYSQTQQFFRLFMVPGMAHCSGGVGPQPQNLLGSVVNWVEGGVAPDTVTASKTSGGVVTTRPLCPYPAFAKYLGSGDPNSASNFVCSAN